MKSTKIVKDLNDIILPFTITFPVTIEGSINSDTYRFKANEEVTLTFAQYEVLRTTPYVKYLD